MEQKFLNILVVVLLVGIIGVSSAAVIQQMSYQSLDSEYQDLLTDYETLSSEWNVTSDDLNKLQSAYLMLVEDYDSLNEIYLIVVSDNANLQQSLDDLQELYDQLLVDFLSLNASFAELSESYDALQADYAQLQSDYNGLQDSYNALVLAYDALELQYNVLVLDYNTLLANYNTLVEDFLALQSDYNMLELSYNTLATWIRQQILPAQYMVFAEAVRRYYFEDFYVQNKWGEGNISGYWAEFTRFCRDAILHDSQIGPDLEGSWFPDMSNALADCLRFGNLTENLAFQNFWNVFYPWIPNWGNWMLPPDDLDAIAQVIQWCVDNIDYEYDSTITIAQEPYAWDYIKFPVETAFRTMGDCEDQAVLCAAYLESCGFETAMAVFHDDDHPTLGEFYHGVLRVHIEDTAAFSLRYPLCSLWRMAESIDPYWPDYTWCWVDPTWDVLFGFEPTWLLPYKVTGISYTVMTVAICDLNGAVSCFDSGTALEAYVL